MNVYKDDYIYYRISKSKEALADALLLIEEKRWNASINRLYYTCFYIVSALLLKYNIDAKTHTGIKNQFNLQFIKQGIVSTHHGRLYSDLFDSRQKGDYGDLYDFEEDAVKSLIDPVKEFITEIEKIILL